MPASPSVERVVVVGGCPAERQDAVMAAARLQPHLLHVGFVKDAVSTDHAGCGAGATAPHAIGRTTVWWHMRCARCVAVVVWRRQGAVAAVSAAAAAIHRQ